MDRRQFVQTAVVPLTPLSLFDKRMWEDPPDEVLDTFMGPMLDKMMEDDRLRRRFTQYLKKRLGPKYPDFMMRTVLDEFPEIRSRPLIYRMMYKKIYGSAPTRGRGLIRRRRR